MEGLHDFSVSVAEIKLPQLREQSQVSCRFVLRDRALESVYPFDKPLLFDDVELTNEDSLWLTVYDRSYAVTELEIQLKEQFPLKLSGQFEKWFVVKADARSPDRVRSALRDPETSGKVLISVKIEQKVIHVPPPPVVEIEDCQRCRYLKTLTETQQKEIDFFQENSGPLGSLAAVLDKYTEKLSVKPADISNSLNLDSLALDLQDSLKFQLGPLDAKKAEHLRTLLIGLNQKLKAMQLLIHEVFYLRNELKASRIVQTDLHDEIKKSDEEHREECERLDQELKKISKNRSDLAVELQTTKEDLRSSEEHAEKLNSSLQFAKAKIEQLTAEQQNFDTLKTHISSLQSELKEAEIDRAKLRKTFEQNIEEFSKNVQQKDNLLSQINKEKSDVAGKLQEVSTELKTKHKEFDLEVQQKLALTASVSELQSDIKRRGDVAKLAAELEELTGDQTKMLERLHTEYDFAVNEFELKTQELSKLNEAYSEKAVKLEDMLEKVEGELDVQETAIEEQQKYKYELVGKIATLEQALCVNEDRQEILDSYQEKLKQNDAVKTQLTKELSMTSDYLLAQTTRATKAVKATTKLGEILEEREHEIEVLREVVTELKRVPTTYHPARVNLTQDDPIDMALADFINNSEVPIIVPFTREDPGVYLFGTKRVFVKLENGKIISKG